jgi:methyl-accepting chemotaxis protein
MSVLSWLTGLSKASPTGPSLRSITDKVPANIMFANMDMEIVYANKRSLDTLAGLSDLFSFDVSTVEGTSIDNFHGNPAYQRKILSNPSNLPHEALIQVGPETLSLHIEAGLDEDGNYMGPIVTWDVVTQKIKLEREQLTLERMVEDAPVNLIKADSEFNIVKINTKGLETLRKLQRHISVPVNQLMGNSIDIFHNDPGRIRAIVSNPANLPHEATIELAGEFLEVLVSPTFDTQGNFDGPMLTWTVVTEDVEKDERTTAMTTELVACAEELRVSATELIHSAESSIESSQVTLGKAQSVNTNATMVATSAEEMSISIQSISGSTHELSDALDRAAQTAVEAAQRMEVLAEANEEIARVGESIADIADQTNLLALNATIEAAGAGEAGRGFAVVAAEVKDLARETMLATDSIKEQVRNVTTRANDVSQAVSTINEVIEQVNLLSTILSGAVEEQSITTREIACAIGEAAVGSDEIAAQMEDLHSSANTSNHNAQGVLEAAEQLRNLAQGLSLNQR